MLIIGAKGFAKEVLEVCHQNGELENLYFYDDVNYDTLDKLYNTFPILKLEQEAEKYFNTIDPRFTIGIGNPRLREMMVQKFSSLGGRLISTISPKSSIGTYDVTIGNGANILEGAIISNSVSIGIASIIYYHSIITHDCVIGDYVEISPNVKILGRVKIGNRTQLGSNCTILPDVTIGNNVIVGAGTVVLKDVPDNSTIVGNPGRIIKK